MPACKTCPWYSEMEAEGEFVDGYCHNAQSTKIPTPNYWCSLHPDAPKPIYDLGLAHPDATLSDGWEPMPTFDDNGNVLVRRVVGYLKAGEP